MKKTAREQTKNDPQLCPNCQVGRDSFLLDNRSPYCHYIGFHNGKACSKFKPIQQNECDTEFE